MTTQLHFIGSTYYFSTVDFIQLVSLFKLLFGTKKPDQEPGTINLSNLKSKKSES